MFFLWEGGELGYFANLAEKKIVWNKKKTNGAKPKKKKQEEVVAREAVPGCHWITHTSYCWRRSSRRCYTPSGSKITNCTFKKLFNNSHPFNSRFNWNGRKSGRVPKPFNWSSCGFGIKT